LTSHPLLSLLLPPPPRSTLFPYTTLVRSPDEARRRCGRGDRVNRLDAALEPRVTGLHDAPVPSGNADLELAGDQAADAAALVTVDRKSTRLNSSHVASSYAVFCLKKKKIN